MKEEHKATHDRIQKLNAEIIVSIKQFEEDTGFRISESGVKIHRDIFSASHDGRMNIAKVSIHLEGI